MAPDPTRRPRAVPLGKPLASTDADRARAAEITPEDLAILPSKTPASARPYLEAAPTDADEPA